MPNWTTNYVAINGSKKNLDKIQKEMKGKDTAFDFNALIPMPESLNVTAGSETDEAIVAYLTEKLSVKPSRRSKKSARVYELVRNSFSKDWPKEVYGRLLKKKPDEIDRLYELGKQYVSNYDLYGHTTWYEWCRDKWGTKWNACSVEVDRSDKYLEYRFDTAWSAPFPVIDAMREKYPEVDISHSYLDEGNDEEYEY